MERESEREASEGRGLNGGFTLLKSHRVISIVLTSNKSMVNCIHKVLSASKLSIWRIQ